MKKRRRKEPTKNEYLKDEETEDCTEEGFRFVSDYHDSMNAADFEAYFADLCKKLPASSVIVLDNAPYHSKNSESYSNSKWEKTQLLDWLNKKNISVPPKALRAELRVLMKQETEKFPSKIIEAIAEQAGHVVLRLPPCHCELNPTESACAAEKNYVLTLDLIESAL